MGSEPITFTSAERQWMILSVAVRGARFITASRRLPLPARGKPCLPASRGS
jgi:hypothetical protein